MSRMSGSSRARPRGLTVLLACLAFANAACDAQQGDGASAPMAATPAGGPCTYKHTPGTVTVLAVLRSSNSTMVRFAYRPDNASEALRTDSGLEGQLSGSAPQSGSTFAAVRWQIISGSCMPLDYIATIGGRSERLTYHSADNR